MATSPQYLIERPKADTETIEQLVKFAQKGRLRIPTFQRGLKWTSDDVLALFDSIYKGYPIGSLLLQIRNAPAERIYLGPLEIMAEKLTNAWSVVDGQQRLTALAASLARPMPLPTTPDNPYVVYFDVDKQVFVTPPPKGGVPDTWVPVPILLDTATLQEWVFEWPHGRDAVRRAVLYEVGKRLREYQVPLYIVDLPDGDQQEEVLHEIFYRTNNAGKTMSWTDVHNALYGSSGQKLEGLIAELEKSGMGKPTETLLLTCLIAFEGHDPTRNLGLLVQKDRDALQETARDVVPTLQRVLSFLRAEAEIPHLRLLPQSPPLIVLTRYFRLFPSPSPRALQLLVRWVWRTLLGTALFNERTLLRHGVSLLNANDDSEKAAQRLLALVPRTIPEELAYQLPPRFDARAAASRLLLLGLASLPPLDLAGNPRDVAQLLEEAPVAKKQGVAVYQVVLPNIPAPANRILLPADDAVPSVRRLLLAMPPARLQALLLAHAITPEAFRALEQNDVEAFLRLRGETLQQLVRDMGQRLAQWGANDRISVAEIMSTSDAAEA